MNWKKWLITGLGWAIGGPIGALLGYFVGSSISGEPSAERLEDGHSAFGPQSRRRHTNTGSEQDLTAALLVLIAAVMKADGVVRKSELDYVKRFLLKNYGEEKSRELLLLLRDMVKKEIPLREVCGQIKANTDYTTRYHMVDFLFGVAHADNEFDLDEERTLRSVSNYLGLNATDFVSIYARHRSGGNTSDSRRRTSYGSASASRPDPYQVLGITSDATDDEVRKAYRRLAMKYHPDKVSGLGEEMKRNAEEQFHTINEAYETIKAARGFK